MRGAAIGAIGALLVGNVWSLQFTLSLDDLTGPGFSASGISIGLIGTAQSALSVNIASVNFASRAWKNVQLRCPRLRINSHSIDCPSGELQTDVRIPVSFSYAIDRRALDVVLMPAVGESWRLAMRTAKSGTDTEITIDGGKLQRLATWLPPNLPSISKGTVKGVIRYGNSGKISAKLAIAALAFSDKQGLHAGEKINANIEAQAERRGEQWLWKTNVEWTEGEAFWQPLYLKAGRQSILAEGSYDPKILRIESAVLRYPGLGVTNFSMVYDHPDGKLVDATLRSGRVKAQPLYDLVLKPFLAQSTFSDLRADGDVTLAAELDRRGVRSIDVQLDNFSFEDKGGKFSLFQVDGRIPWRADERTISDITVKGGELLRMPLGGFTLPLSMNGMHFELRSLRVPFLDGKLEVRDFAARGGGESWYWQFGAELSEIPMEKFTQALGLPMMHGTLSATIPTVRHVKSTLRADGALSFKVFDGIVEAKNLVLLDIFGKAPRVQAEVHMRNLDLELVTRAFSFGGITGRIDARIGGLEIVNWQPVAFDAVLESSAGDYPRKISQAAVQNISALGGAGAAAAIQRSFLRFFNQFGYSKIGLKCKLLNEVCEMSGIGNAPHGYVIVEGGGIPSITVMGYTRRVSWRELLQRLKRITQENVKPIVE